MARVTVEDCIQKVDNQFDLVLLAAHRARMISSGSQITLDRDNDKNPVRCSARDRGRRDFARRSERGSRTFAPEIRGSRRTRTPEPSPWWPPTAPRSVRRRCRWHGPDDREELLKGLEGLTPPEERPEPMEADDEE